MNTLIEKIFEVIAVRTGLTIRMNDRSSLNAFILSKIRSFDCSGLDTYAKILESDTSESRKEWKELISAVTIGESFFFRDQGQFGLLEKKILPELIDLRKNEKKLKIWSAGCSTGEEAYSLAILLDKIVTSRHEWKISITGTDINEDSIKKAREGLYGQWSFRRVDKEVVNGYFRKKMDQWEIISKIRNMVVFKSLNIMDAAVPSNVPNHAPFNTIDLHDMDLIICRNLFIYFDKKAISKVLNFFSDSLRKRGFLMTGHGELHGQKLVNLSPLIFSESVVYRKNDESAPLKPETQEKPKQDIRSYLKHEYDTPKKPFSFAYPVPNGKKNIKETIIETKRVHEETDFKGVHKRKEPVHDIYSKNKEDSYGKARALAGMGHYDEAARQAERLLAMDPENCAAYLLLAQISEIRGNHESAKDYLKKIIYLNPESISAHIELGSIYQKEKDLLRAEKMLKTALSLIKALPPETVIEEYENMTARELETYLGNMTSK